MKFFESGTTMVDVLNDVRGKASYTYRNNVPEATDSNVYDIITMLASDTNMINEFMAVLNKVALTNVYNRRYKNEMTPLHKGQLSKGRTIEQIFVELAEVHEYDPNSGEKMLKRVRPNIKSAYNIALDKKYIKQTVSMQTMLQAVNDIEVLDRVISGIITTMHNTAEVYDSDYIKAMLVGVAKKQQQGFAYIPPVIDRETAENAAIMINELSDNMTFMQSDYNFAKVHTFTPKEEQMLILDTKMKNTLSIKVLANAFNLSEAEFRQRYTLTWRDFGKLSTSEYGVWGWLGDKEYFQIWDVLYSMPTPVYNPESLDNTHWLHKWTNYGINPFANGVFLTSKEPVISSYTLTPESTTLGAGDSAKFTVTVEGTGLVTADSDFTLSGNTSDSTTIDEFGYLVLGADEAGPTITVTATSKLDSTKTDTATVTVS